MSRVAWQEKEKKNVLHFSDSMPNFNMVSKQTTAYMKTLHFSSSPFRLFFIYVIPSQYTSFLQKVFNI